MVATIGSELEDTVEAQCFFHRSYKQSFKLPARIFKVGQDLLYRTRWVREEFRDMEINGCYIGIEGRVYCMECSRTMIDI